MSLLRDVNKGGAVLLQVSSTTTLEGKGQLKFTSGKWSPHHNCSQLATANDTAIRGWDLRNMRWALHMITICKVNLCGTLFLNACWFGNISTTNVRFIQGDIFSTYWWVLNLVLLCAAWMTGTQRGLVKNLWIFFDGLATHQCSSPSGFVPRCPMACPVAPYLFEVWIQQLANPYK